MTGDPILAVLAEIRDGIHSTNARRGRRLERAYDDLDERVTALEAREPG